MLIFFFFLDFFKVRACRCARFPIDAQIHSVRISLSAHKRTTLVPPHSAHAIVGAKLLTAHTYAH